MSERRGELTIVETEQSTVDDRLARDNAVLVEVWQALRVRLLDTGIESALTMLPRPEQARYQLETDPVDQSETLVGTWYDDKGYKLGAIQLRQDGKLYAEVDVVRNHPTDARWFVEAVTAWGDASNIKTELRLLAAV